MKMDKQVPGQLSFKDLRNAKKSTPCCGDCVCRNCLYWQRGRCPHGECYEIKSCREDVYSGNGMNFVGEKNYIVTTMECYKQLQPDIRSGKLWNHISECNPESSMHIGVMVPVPWSFKPTDEYENPTELRNDIEWELKAVLPCHPGRRKRSMIELLFCMLRSGH